jgi:putative transcriptional regulator
VLFRGESEDATAEQEHVFAVEGEIRIAATLEVLGRFLQPETEQPFRLLLGYAGWGPGQLEGEIHRGDWIPMEVDDSLVFDADTAALWRKALDRLGLHPGGFMVGPGGKA